jgi:hypothetical protein
MGKSSIRESLRNQIIEKRQQGLSIPELHRMFGISKSTALRYAGNVEILPEFKQRWLDRRNASKIISENSWKIANEVSTELISSINQKELKIFGAILYWAEGAKREFSFINSDPRMVKFFVKILVSAYKVPSSSIQVSLRLFEDISVPDAIKFWSGITELELSNSIPIEIKKGSKVGKLKYGMCRIRVKKGGLLLKTMFAINKRVMSLVSPRSSMDSEQ